MKRIPTYGQALALACAAFTVTGCAPDQGNTGGIEATLILDADAVEKHFTQLGVAIVCDGIDPITGLPWPTEIFTVNLSTSEGNDPTDPKDSLGLFKKEGLPEGNCEVLIGGPSDDGTMHCGGYMDDIPVVAGPDNTFVTIVINCITEARYGGIGVTGEFNQCMEYSQITVSPTTQSVGNDIDVDIWCYDPDSDDGQGFILFMTAASVTANPSDPSLWVECGPVSTAPVFPCNHQDPPTDPLTPSASETVTCNVSNEDCLIIVSVSDDYFAHIFNDWTGCHGQNDGAHAVIPVYCQSTAVCGDDVVELPEECDPPSGATTNPDGFWCDAQCKIFHSCNNDGVIDPGEECDDGNTVNGDGCDDSCVWEWQQATLNVCCNAPVIGQIDVATAYDYVPLTPVQQGQPAQMQLTGVVDLSSIGIAIDLVVIAPSDVGVVGTAGTTSSETLPIPTPQSINPVTQPLVQTGTNTMSVAVDVAATQVCLDLSAITVNVDLGLTVACTTGTCAGTLNTPMCVPAYP